MASEYTGAASSQPRIRSAPEREAEAQVRPRPWQPTRNRGSPGFGLTPPSLAMGLLSVTDWTGALDRNRRADESTGHWERRLSGRKRRSARIK